MKRSLLLMVFVCISAIAAAAQEDSPPAPPEYEPQSWKEYSYKEDNVRFRFPAEPQVTNNQAKKERSYKRNSFMSFELTVSDAGIDVGKDSRKQRMFLTLVSMSLDEVIKNSGGKLIKREEVTVDGSPAIFIHHESTDGLVTRAVLFALKDKLYAAQVEVKKGRGHGIIWENDLEKPAMAFLDSIHLISK